MDIMTAAQKLEAFLAGYDGAGGKRAREIRVHPSGDDAQEIKVWVDLGAGVSPADCEAWAAQCSADAAASAAPYAVHVRAESL